jgi:hypothetical protein
MEQNILLQNEEGMTLLEAFYGKGFYEPEMQTGMETGRWIEQSAIVNLEAQQEVSGTLTFTVFSYGSTRTLQVLLDDVMILERSIPPQRLKLFLPVSLTRGQHELVVRSVEPPGNDGERKLSIRVWNLQFSRTK